jgi:hypothetical protein
MSAIENPFYTHEFQLLSIGRLDLEEGGVIPDCHLAVTTFGELSPERDNAVLVTTWYAGSHQAWRDATSRKIFNGATTARAALSRRTRGFASEWRYATTLSTGPHR